MLLKGKTAVITGSNRGIGKATLERFAMHGANVFAHARKETEEFKDVCKKMSEKYNVSIVPLYFDVADEDAVKEGIKEIAKTVKDIDILVNNVGVVNNVKLFQMMNIQEIREQFEVNFFSHPLITQLISRFMIRRRKGSIINISSCAGIDGNTGMLDYVSSKAAIIGATKRLAIELGAYNIRVNSVAPGLTETEMGNKMDEKLLEDMLRKLVIKRKAKPEEIADAIVFFGSDMSSFITGQVMRVDGGMLQ